MKTIILDTDLGTNPDDFFALLMLLNHPDIALKLVISGNGFPQERARFAHKIIQQHGAHGVRVYSGERAGCSDFHAYQHIENHHPEISGRYIEAIASVLDGHDSVTYLCIESLSAIAAFLQAHPEYKDTFDIVHMGARIDTGANFIAGGTNIEADPHAAKYLYELGLKRLKVVGSHTTTADSIRVTPDTAIYKKLQASTRANHRMLLDHLHDFNTRRGIWPALHDPLTASVVLGCEHVTFSGQRLEFNERGAYRVSATGVAVAISDHEINDPAGFMRLVAEMV